MSHKCLILVHTVKVKPIINAKISGKLVTNGVSDVVTTSVHSEKTRMKKLIMIIIITSKWLPLQGELAPLTKMWYFLDNKPILIHSMLAAGIVQNTFSGEAGESEGGEEKTTGGYFYCYFYWFRERSEAD